MSIGIDVVGASSAGIVSTIFQAGGGVVDYVKREQQEQAAARSADGALAAAIAADAAATNAVARAIASAQIAKIDPSKAATAKADKTTADAAVVAQDKAGAAVPEEKRADRVRAAQEVVDDAAARVKAASGSAKAIAQARLGAATQTLSRARGGSSVEKDVGGEGGGFGTVKAVLIGVGAVLAVGAAAIAFKRH